MKKFFLLLLLIVFFGFIFVYWAIYLPVDFGAGEEVVFSIKRGEGAKEISINLQKQGLIKLKSLYDFLTIGILFFYNILNKEKKQTSTP